jgi:hypothetical protein
MGRTYYTVPWAMVADADGKLWLRRSFPLFDKPEQATVTMRVELHEDGYHVWPVKGEQYVPDGTGTDLPVAVLEGQLSGEETARARQKGKNRMKVMRQSRVSVEMDGKEAESLSDDVSTVLTAVTMLSNEHRARLYDTGVIDRVSAFVRSLRFPQEEVKGDDQK